MLCHFLESVRKSGEDPVGKITFPVRKLRVVQDDPSVFFDKIEVFISDLFLNRLGHDIDRLLIGGICHFFHKGFRVFYADRDRFQFRFLRFDLLILNRHFFFLFQQDIILFF